MVMSIRTLKLNNEMTILLKIPVAAMSEEFDLLESDQNIRGISEVDTHFHTAPHYVELDAI